jgi:hypothetical protein
MVWVRKGLYRLENAKMVLEYMYAYLHISLAIAKRYPRGVSDNGNQI